MKRRALLLLSGAWLLAAAGATFSEPAKLHRIAFVSPGTQSGYQSYFAAFRGSLKEMGYVEGRDISIMARWNDDRTERLANLAAEVVASNPDVIVTASSAAVAAFKKATPSIPIVFASAGNPVEQGFVSSLQHPGGNITWVIAQVGLYQKIVEIAREALPAARNLALLVHDADPFHKSIVKDFESGARRLKLQPLVVRVGGGAEFDRAFEELLERKADALFVPNLVLFASYRRDLSERAIKARLPLLSINPLYVQSGALLSYGTDTRENYRRVAALVDKILRGAKPGDLAVEQPERFQLIVNRKTAQAIGVKLSPVTMLRADRIID